jgi:hypothetical protein
VAKKKQLCVRPHSCFSGQKAEGLLQPGFAVGKSSDSSVDDLTAIVKRGGCFFTICASRPTRRLCRESPCHYFPAASFLSVPTTSQAYNRSLAFRAGSFSILVCLLGDPVR